jgi:hypothetical protein
VLRKAWTISGLAGRDVPGRDELATALAMRRGEQTGASPPWAAPAYSICQEPMPTTVHGDRNYLVLTKPNVIMNDIRLRGLAVAGTDAPGRKSPHNHAQTARNLKRSLRNAAAGARLIQTDGLDSKSAADVATSLADALEELHRLERRLDRRIRREQRRSEEPTS